MKRERILLVACSWVTALTLAMGRDAPAHEGHAALPSTGAAVDGNQLLLSPAAIQAVGRKTEDGFSITEKIKLGDLHHTLRVNARVQLPWSRQAKVASLTAGRVLDVLVKPGDTVQVDQELARIESLELESLQTELMQSAAEVELLERLVQQRERLSAGGGIAGKLLLETKADLQRKTAQFEIARRKLQALGLDDDALRRLKTTGETVQWISVVSPLSGVVESIDARPGQLVGATEHLFDIVDLSTLYVAGEVLEADAFLLEPGLPARMTFAGLPRELDGQIGHVRMKMDGSKRTLHAVVQVNNKQGLLRPGMFGRMSIEVAVARREILCPTTALIETPRGVYVLRRVGEGKFNRHPVTIGMRSPHKVVVKSGLFPGQQVITVGRHLLAAMFDGIPEPNAPTTAAAANSPPKAAATPVSTSNAPSTRPVLAAKATVEVPTRRKSLATSLIEGRVAQILVEPGQAVKAGAVLAEVESQQLRNLQLELLQSAGKLAWTSGEVERLRPVARSGAPARQLWQREIEVKTLSQKVASLARRLSLIGLSKEKIEQLRAGSLAEAAVARPRIPIAGRVPIRAPLAGRVADIGLTLGQIVHSDDSLFEIQDTRSMWVKGLVLERDSRRVAAGQHATVTFPANPQLRIRGKVVRVAPQLNSRDRVLPVWIEVANEDGFLKDGMLARVEIHAPLWRAAPRREETTARSAVPR